MSTDALVPKSFREDSSYKSDSERELLHVGNIHGLRLRHKCFRKVGLKEIRSTNLLYSKVLSYRTYRLYNYRYSRTTTETGKVRDLIMRMSLPIEKHHFRGAYPIKILDFHAHFVKEANIKKNSEDKSFVALPSSSEFFSQT